MYDVPQPVLFRHCDPAGIVFYPRYFEMLNDAVEAFFGGALGWSFVAMHEAGFGVPTVDLRMGFTAISRHGDALIFRLAVEKLGGASLTLGVVATCDGETRLRGEVVLVCIGPDRRATRWPDTVRARLQDHLEQTGETDEHRS